MSHSRCSWFYVLLLLIIPFFSEARINELIRANGNEPGSLDPHHMIHPSEGTIGYDLFEGLTTYNNYGELIPGQAERWQVSNDGKTWTFTIRTGLKWSDGTALNASDFEYSLRRLADPATAAAYSWFMATMAITNAADIIKGKKAVNQLGVKAINPTTLEFYLDSPVSYFPDLLASYCFLPVPRHVIEKKGGKWALPDNAVSNGAFKLKEWTVNDNIRVVKNAHYRENPLNQLDSVVYIAGGNALARFRAGEVHMTGTISQEQEKWTLKNRPEWLKLEPWMSVGVLFLNMKQNKLKETTNRRALAMALNRETLAASGALGTATAAWHIVPPQFDDFSPQLSADLRKPIRDRAKLAKTFLHAMDSITISYSSSDVLEKGLAIATAQEWKKHLGIDVKLNGYEDKAYYEFLDKGQYDVAIIRWVGPYKDPASLLCIWHSNSPSNRSFYQSLAFDDLLEKARAMVGQSTARMRLYSQAEELLMKDVPAIPLLHHKNARLVSEQVEGYLGLNPMGRIYSRYLSVKEKMK